MAQENRETLRTCEDLKKEFKNLNYKDDSSHIQFTGADGKDVYNITAPFEADGKMYIAGRVEARDSEHSKVVFFEKIGDTWAADLTAGTLTLQDPFVDRRRTGHWRRGDLR